MSKDMKSQIQMYYESRRKIAEYNIDLDIIRKATVKHYIQDGIDFNTAWMLEEKINEKIKHKTSIIFPNQQTLFNYFERAIK